MSSQDRPGAHLGNIFGRCFVCTRPCWTTNGCPMSVCMGVSPPTERSCNWCWKMRGSPGCVRCLK